MGVVHGARMARVARDVNAEGAGDVCACVCFVR